MQVRVLFFGVLKDIAQRSEELLELEPGASLAAVLEHCARRYPPLGRMASDIALARNRRFAAPSTRLEEGDEVALLPPVSGGADPPAREIVEPGARFALTREPIEPDALARGLARPEDGAVVSFQGVVRNHSRGRATLFLDYESYEPMALQMMAQIGRELAERHGLGRIAIVHRLGRLRIGEISVVVMAAAPHREAAFRAVMEGIDRLKRSVPIWKKEHFADGECWVEGAWDRALLEP